MKLEAIAALLLKCGYRSSSWQKELVGRQGDRLTRTGTSADDAHHRRGSSYSLTDSGSGFYFATLNGALGLTATDVVIQA
ncbi:hypothetical protein H6G89_20745 [Oscillatoria sp. FACHB-1407]|uniref:hypothetical protein n=1 Tax=Oscillatoria sp. FACHB-1407 TaxID=2692847 RepID=UPI0016891D05|nr:hypothetical protein [Oscillatoria sp. FACHB-1407]MBD2463441.1 hypothetical protein [Oscillatoria sp. FACHB-1407]